ncbi:MAG: SMC-Scp complex subunit ScpB [Terrimicrobiaceae bacterium]
MSDEPPIPLPRIIESILFASQKPISFKELSSIFKGASDGAKENPGITCFAKVKREEIEVALQQLETEYLETGRAFEVRESAAGWQLVTRADFAPWLRQLFPENRSAKLSAPALETLAIIAYRQPITRADMEAVRGVAVDGVMQTLLDRGLVRIAGRAEIPGRPLLYETTQFFMEHFGLKDLDDLPNAGELRRIPLPKAEPPAEPAAAEKKEDSATEAQPDLVSVEEPAPAPVVAEDPAELPVEESVEPATVEETPVEPEEEIK